MYIIWFCVHHILNTQETLISQLKFNNCCVKFSIVCHARCHEAIPAMLWQLKIGVIIIHAVVVVIIINPFNASCSKLLLF